ncbi:MAG TPA: type I methionyl aminopeptidase [Ktedonobacterales bacterium]
MGITIKNRDELALMREAGKIVVETLELLRSIIRPGITTAQLDQATEEAIRARGAIPSFLGFHGFPASLCASVNNELVHGIPGPRVLQEGDLIKIDTGARYQGYHGDACISVPVGKVSSQVERLMTTCEQALWKGIEQARAGNHLGDIGAAIQRFVEGHGYAIVRNCTGHGIGRDLHEEPFVLHYGEPGKGLQLKPGMVITIEPIVNIGAPGTRTLADGWTMVTADGSLSAQFEHTLAITSQDPDILTPWKSTLSMQR